LGWQGAVGHLKTGDVVVLEICDTELWREDSFAREILVGGTEKFKICCTRQVRELGRKYCWFLVQLINEKIPTHKSFPIFMSS
jgi:hypothetical protein